MKLKNIIVTGVMLSAMISTVAVSSGFADTQKITISAGKETAEAGKSFSVDISISDIQPTGMNACEFAIQYDSSIISIDSVEKGSITNTGADTKDTTASDVLIFDSEISEDTVNVVWTTGADSDYWIKDSGIFCTVSGKVSSSASNGDVALIKLIPIARDTNPDSGKVNDKMVFSYIDGDSKAYYDYSVSDGSVTVGKASSGNILWGDVNVDGKVEIADVVSASAYVGDSGNNAIETQGLINGDVQNNGDGITSGDVLAIQQYLANIVAVLPV